MSSRALRSSRIPRRINQKYSFAALFPRRRESSANNARCSGQNHIVETLRGNFSINWVPNFAGIMHWPSIGQCGINTLSFLLLMGYATLSGAADQCKVIDPDLAQGVYAGGCKNGLADGYGEVSGTSSYRGGFSAGKKHGKGIKVMPNGDRYAGDFSDDYRHGKGVYVWGASTPWAGDRYEGEYQRDLRHGWGIFQWNGGDRYEGQWQNDLRMGPSVMELRRAQAAEAAAKSVKVGGQVCAEAQLGLVNRQRIRGKVESGTGDSVQVRITEVEGGIASYQGNVLKTGDVITDAAVHWQPCGNN